MPYQFSSNYWRNNKQFLTFLIIILLTNVVLFVTRAYYFRDFSMLNGFKPNPFYMMSRANGAYFKKITQQVQKFSNENSHEYGMQ